MHTVRQSVDFPTLIRRLSPFSSLSEPAVKDLEQRFTYRRYATGQVVLSPTKVVDELYLIRTGSAQVLLDDRSGGRILLHTLGVGDLFGRPLPAERYSRATSIVAVEEMSALVLTREESLQHLSRYPGTSLIFLKVMAERLEKAYETMACLSLGDVSSRFQRLLLLLASREGVSSKDGVVLPKRLTQKEMARMIGARRETVSRLISQFVAEGILQRRGRSLILLKPADLG